jgi:hypothetical protein
MSVAPGRIATAELTSVIDRDADRGVQRVRGRERVPQARQGEVGPDAKS